VAYQIEAMEKIKGQTPVEINGMKEGSEKVEIITAEGGKLTIVYEHDCCAGCEIVQVDGDPMDLLGAPLLMCEEDGNVGEQESKDKEYPDESFTWTFVKFASVHGYVTLRWYGSSNGYYSEAPTCYYEGPGAGERDGRPSWR
jgi:hypothetical protein